MDEVNTGYGDVSGLRREWWLFLLLGIVLIGLGILAIFYPFVATLGVALTLGWVLLIAGVVHGINAFRFWKAGGFIEHILIAILYLIVGVFLIKYPITGAVALTLLVAGLFIAEGVIRIVLATRHVWMPQRGWVLFIGVLDILLALLIISSMPVAALWVIGLLFGIDMILGGFSLLTLALALHSGRTGARMGLAGQA